MKKFSHYLVEAEQHQYRPLPGDTVSFQINEELEIVAEVDELTEDGIVLNLDETALGLMTGLALIEDSTVSYQGWTLHNERDDEEDKINWFHYLSGGPDNIKQKFLKGSPNREMNLDDLKNYLSKHQMTENDLQDGHSCPSCGSSNIEIEKRNYGSDSETGYQDSDEYIVCKDCGAEEIAEAADVLSEAEYQGRSVQLGKPMRGDVRKFKVFVKDPKTGNVKKVNFGDPNMEIKRDDPARRKNFRARHGCGTGRASDRTKAAYWSCRMWSTKPVSKIVKELDFHQMTPAERTALRIKQNREIEDKAEKETQNVKDYWRSMQSQVTSCIIDFNIQLSNYIHRNFPQESVYAKLENGYLYIAKPELVASNSHQDLKELGYRQVTDRGVKNSALLQINPMPLRQVLQNDFEMGGRYRLSEKPEVDDYAIGFRAEYVSTVNPSKKEKIQLGTMGFTIAPSYSTAR